MTTPPVRRVLIVEDGLGPHPLVAARSFGEAGWTVGVGSPVREGRAVSSRHVSAWHPVPPAETDERTFVAATVAAIETGRYDLVFGADDVEVLALSAARDELAARGAIFPYPAHDVVVATIDKLAVTGAAERAGVPVPRTRDAASGLLPDDLTYPAVVKARLHWTPGTADVPARLERAICATPQEVAEAVTRMLAAGGSPIVQERIDGGLGALTLLLDRDGQVRARLQQEAERISPFWHNSVAARTVPVDEDLVERVVGMLRDLGWWGLVNLQFLLPGGTWVASTGDAAGRLIDVNGRFYGSIALARAAGLDLPLLWGKLALEHGDSARYPAGPALTGRAGVRYQSLEEDLRRAVTERRGGLVRDVRATIRYASGATHSTWAADDRRPALLRSRSVVRSESRELARRLLRRR
ncbi:MAG: hypothetical protein QOC98_2563 [Frankiaceae bacterium]|nr:hypothetical protein [Frankiaceae bacterium]